MKLKKRHKDKANIECPIVTRSPKSGVSLHPTRLRMMGMRTKLVQNYSIGGQIVKICNVLKIVGNNDTGMDIPLLRMFCINTSLV